MKLFKCLIIVVCLFTSQVILSQEKTDNRIIEVVGSSETEVTPDIIHLAIEYQDNTSSKKQMSIQDFEENLFMILENMKIDKNNLYVDGVSGGRYKMKTKKTVMKKNKRYVVILNDLSKIDDLTDELESYGITDYYIKEVAYSKTQEIRKEVKINAIKAAKEKAEYLLQAIGKQVGDPLYVKENDLKTNYYEDRDGYSNTALYSSSKVSEEVQNINMRKLKFRHEVFVKFLIK